MNTLLKISLIMLTCLNGMSNASWADLLLKGSNGKPSIWDDYIASITQDRVNTTKALLPPEHLLGVDAYGRRAVLLSKYNHAFMEKIKTPLDILYNNLTQEPLDPTESGLSNQYHQNCGLLLQATQACLDLTKEYEDTIAGLNDAQPKTHNGLDDPD